MTYSVRIKASAQKEIAALETEDRKRVVDAVDALASNPHRGTLLKGEHTGLRRIRVGHFRIIYEVQRRVLVILVLRVGHRRDVYR